MSFIRATIQIKPASVGTGIKCLLRQTKKMAATITLTINAATAKELSIDDNCGIEVMIGDGEHHGLIRIRKNNSAADTKAIGRDTGKGGFFLIKLGHQPAFVDRSEPSAWCQWEKVEEGWIEIVLPKWADESAPNKRKAEAPLPKLPLSSAQSANGRSSVTASIMGDPPAGRREMLERIGKVKA